MKRILSIAALLTVAVTQAANLEHPRQVNLDQGDTKRTAAQREAEARSMGLQPTRSMTAGATADNPDFFEQAARRASAYVSATGDMANVLNGIAPTSVGRTAYQRTPPRLHQITIDPALRTLMLATCPSELNTIVDVLKKRHKYAPDVLPKKLLFVGPPGTGKTSLGQALADECGMPCFVYPGSFIANEYEHSGDQNLADIIEQAASLKKPCVVLIDEVQALIKNPETPLADFSPLIALWSLFDNFKNTDIVFICTLNYSTIPLPLQQRCEVITIGLPEKDEQRKEIINFYTEKFKIGMCKLVQKRMLSDTNGLPPRLIEAIVTRATRAALVRSEKSPETCSHIICKDWSDAVASVKDAAKKLKPGKSKSETALDFAKNAITFGAPTIGTVTSVASYFTHKNDAKNALNMQAYLAQHQLDASFSNNPVSQAAQLKSGRELVQHIQNNSSPKVLSGWSCIIQ